MTVAEVVAKLRQRADLYISSDGKTLGPLATAWGFRDIAQHIRAVADEIEAADSE